LQPLKPGAPGLAEISDISPYGELIKLAVNSGVTSNEGLNFIGAVAIFVGFNTFIRMTPACSEISEFVVS
jgi:hypothetical protein